VTGTWLQETLSTGKEWPSLGVMPADLRGRGLLASQAFRDRLQPSASDPDVDARFVDQNF
jgi:hypothetical protein